MTAVAFDTLKFARTLREKAKLTSEQAEGLADAMAEVLQGDIASKADIGAIRVDIKTLRLSTKADIKALTLSTKADLREAEARRDAKIEAAKADIIKRMFGTIGFQTLIVLGTLITLSRNMR